MAHRHTRTHAHTLAWSLHATRSLVARTPHQHTRTLTCQERRVGRSVTGAHGVVLQQRQREPVSIATLPTRDHLVLNLCAQTKAVQFLLTHKSSSVSSTQTLTNTHAQWPVQQGLVLNLNKQTTALCCGHVAGSRKGSHDPTCQPPRAPTLICAPSTSPRSALANARWGTFAGPEEPSRATSKNVHLYAVPRTLSVFSNVTSELYGIWRGVTSRDVALPAR